MNQLSRRVRELERLSGADGSLTTLPLPGQPEKTFRMPRPFAEWLAREGEESYFGGRHFNPTCEEREA